MPVKSNVWIEVALIGCLVAGSASGQHVVSARSGLVHYAEGQVFLGEAISPKPGEYPEIKIGEHLTTKAGRAEVLLMPGAFLRLSENSDVAMLANALTNTRVEVAAGSVILEVEELNSKETSLQLVVGGTVVEILKPGVFRIDASSPALVRVYDGELAVRDKRGEIKVKEGRQVLLTNVPSADKFSKDETDAFLRWAGRRSGYLAAANRMAANQMRQNGVVWSTSGWYYNPLSGMYAFVPRNGHYRNYWDYDYYSPNMVVSPQAPQIGMRDGFSGMGSSVRGMQDRSGGSYSGGGSSSPTYQAPATSSPAPSAPSGGGRGSDSGGSRAGSGGGR